MGSDNGLSPGRRQMETFPRFRPFVGSTVNSPHKGQSHGALMFSLICVCTNGWANHRDAGDFRRHCAHYDVTVMEEFVLFDSLHQWTQERQLGIQWNDLRPFVQSLWQNQLLLYRWIIDDHLVLLFVNKWSNTWCSRWPSLGANRSDLYIEPFVWAGVIHNQSTTWHKKYMTTSTQSIQSNNLYISKVTDVCKIYGTNVYKHSWQHDQRIIAGAHE